MPEDDQTRILRGRPTPASPPPEPQPDEADPLGEATRVLTAREAGLLTDKIVFMCPNGHRIVVSGQFAGKRGKCSKCGVAVQIPGTETAGSAPPAAPVPDEPPTEADEPAPNTPLAAAETPPDEAPMSPIDGDIDGDKENATAAGTGSADESPADWGFVAGEAGEQGAGSAQEGEWPALDPGGLFEDEGANPTAHLVARLWVERQHGGVIELHLAGGSVILPSYFDPAWSRGTHGLFGKEELDGSYTLTAVAWVTVEKVIVRQLTAVPPDMFP